MHAFLQRGGSILSVASLKTGEVVDFPALLRRQRSLAFRLWTVLTGDCGGVMRVFSFILPVGSLFSGCGANSARAAALSRCR
jgi:hypothetical protein